MKFTVLIMAASRRGAEDSVAKIQGLSHKCLVVLDGTPMLQLVVDNLLATRAVGHVVISIESPEIVASIPHLANLLDAGKISTTTSSDTLFSSVAGAVASINNPYPLIISTADNALHTAEMTNYFASACATGTADVYVGMTRAADVLASYPEGARAFHRFRDEGYSSCNLYSLMSPKALKAAKAFEGGGQFGKMPRRIIKAFGLLTLIFYKLRWLSLNEMTRLVSRRNGLKVETVIMPFAEAPIDVDNPQDFALTEKILKARRSHA